MIKVYGRYSASSVAKELIPELVEKGEQFLVFTRSRRAVEVILKESRDRLEDAGFLEKKGRRTKSPGIVEVILHWSGVRSSER